MSDLALYTMDPDTGLVTFSFTNCHRLVSGPEEALQIVAGHLFTTRGSNALVPGLGGSLQEIIRGRALGPGDMKTEAAIRVSRALSSIKASQSPGKSADATVVGLRLLSVSSVDDAVAMNVRIDLLSGNSFSASFRT